MNIKTGSFFIIICLILTAACNTVTRNEMEKKIEGKWQQTGGSGTIADMGLLFEYSFTNTKKFMQDARSSGDAIVVNKQAFKKNGAFKINEDSIHFYNESDLASPFYSAKIKFDSDTKLMLFDSNGELDFERKN